MSTPKDGVEESIANGLAELGLSKAQARVYLAALKLKEGSACEIAKACSLDRAETYRQLKELVRLELVGVELGSPNTYSAKSPHGVIDELLAARRSELASQMQIADQILPKIEGMGGGTRSTSIHKGPKSYRLVPNRRQLKRETDNLFTEIKSELLGVFPGRALSKMVSDSDFDALLDGLKRGIKVRFITDFSDSNLMGARFLCQHIEIRHYPNINFRLVIYDRNITVLGACEDRDAGPNTADEPYIILRDPALAQAMTVFFEHLWEDSVQVDFEKEPPVGAEQQVAL